GTIPACLDSSDFVILVDDIDPTNGAIVDSYGDFNFYFGLKDSATCTDFSSCWGVVHAEDKTLPVIEAPKDTVLFLSCLHKDSIFNNPSSLAITDTAILTDNCLSEPIPVLQFSDVVTENDQCDTIIIKRTFFGEDAAGNEANNYQLIKLLRVSLDSLDILTDVELNIDCDSVKSLPTDAAGNIHPSESGYPFYINHFGDTVEVKQGLCGLAPLYRDVRFEICESQYKLERTWEVSDWCTGGKRTFKQAIKVGDLQSPKVYLPKEPFQVTTNSGECAATLEVPLPEIEEFCSNTSLSVQLYGISNTIFGRVDTLLVGSLTDEGQPLLFRTLPIGQYYMTYQVIDDCKNQVMDTLDIVIADFSKPIVKCTDLLHVTLDNNGFAKVTADDVDEGSWDNCQLDSLLVSRLIETGDDCELLEEPIYTDWESEVYFSCCDLQDSIEVVLRAVDWKGNESRCWMNVILEDKIIPLCIPPVDAIVDCDSFGLAFDFEDIPSLQSQFGIARGIDACSDLTIEELPLEKDLFGCGFGDIIRSFRVIDADGNSSEGDCQQKITILPVHDYDIKFPRDYTTDCLEAFSPDSIEVYSRGCDLLAIEAIDDKLITEGENCFKIFRKHRVINWCEYNGIDEPIIIPRTIDCDTFPGAVDIWVLVRPDSLGTMTFIDSTQSELDSIPFRDSINVNCFNQTANPWGYWVDSDTIPELASRGFWEYTQIIKVSDQIPPVIFVDDTVSYCIDEPDCSATVFVSFSIIDECVEGNITIHTFFEGINNEFEEFSEDPWSIVGRYPKYQMVGIIPEGNYRVEIIADDQCGNESTIDYFLEVVDCSPPGLLCRDGLVAELVPLEEGTDIDGDGDEDLGAIEVWVSDLLASESFDECSGPVEYSINREGEMPDINQKALMLTCDDGDLLNVEVYAWDGADNPFNTQADGTEGGPNSDFCRTFIRIQDNAGAFCNPGAFVEVAGIIQDPSGAPIANSMVQLSGDNPSYQMSNDNGEFYFPRVNVGHDYSFIPSKEDDLLKGVSTLDIIYITKHILGVKVFDSPYQYLAADINQSSSISTYDAILLRKAILRLDPEVNKMAGWRFVDAKVQFSDEENPWEAYQAPVININNLDVDRYDLRFVGIKMGDVSSAGDLRSAEQSGAPYHLVGENKYLQAGETQILEFSLDATEAFDGLQFAFSLDPSSISSYEIVEGLGKANNFIKQDRNHFVVSWDKYSGQQSILPNTILKVAVTAKKATWTSNALRLNAGILTSEAYTNSSSHDLLLQWNELAGTSLTNWSAKVFPNPFEDNLNVTIHSLLPGAMNIELIDVSGKVFYSSKFSVSKGEQTIFLDVESRLPAGVYLLRMTQNDLILTKRIAKY
ncbi:MAG: T9SS type A sorting domain-containing protein, partial [Bacteroidota bacterium]